MRKKNFEIILATTPIRTEKVKGFIANIKTPGNFKFGVHEMNGRWRVTELSTGIAIPGSFADSAEEAVKKAQESIDKCNKEKTCLQGIVKGLETILARTR